MLSVSVTTHADQARSFLVNLTGDLTQRRDLNEALALRLAEELKLHFGRKNQEPNKMDAPKSHFWQKVAAATKVEAVTETGAVVAVAEQRFNIQLFGGTIKPVKARSLTIPLIGDARGETVASYEHKTGHRLFTIPGRNVLFEKTDVGKSENLPGHTQGRVRGRNRSFSVGLASGTAIKAVFALKKSVTIRKDPDALPPPETLLAALREEADDFIKTLGEGGAS